MQIVGVCVCVDYADFLAETLPRSAAALDRVYVVTCASDEETIALCSQHASAVEVLLSEDLHKDNAAFNKAALVRAGQCIAHERHPDAWVIVLDADILLPEDFRGLVEAAGAEEDPTALYGCQRHDFHSREELAADTPSLKFPEKFSHCGYFQMYHDKSKLYPESSHNCGACDEQFASAFPVKKLLPKLNVSHMGLNSKNWNGRTTPRWR